MPDDPAAPPTADAHWRKLPELAIALEDVFAGDLDPVELRLLADPLPTLCWIRAAA